MDREGVTQRVLDALGIILVDKSHIRDNATFAEMLLDDDDVQRLLERLEETFGCQFPQRVRESARKRPDRVSVPVIVDLIMLMGRDLPGRRLRR
ncbi:hypothetical protein NJC40_11570 [Pseudomonas sp. 21LCFQ02]|uniref:hypothetical protein n=1 Tax=Pseudomonas sp. 21LCFQ02 TaxID=2957505 RepID=UPI00209AF74C|nr:hypothetical protein [Pseudomonas sp. 21LCFQ02]MCO8168414.1 hypothetical protein [Pseudomonas sp. 21LCFQ02]